MVSPQKIWIRPCKSKKCENQQIKHQELLLYLLSGRFDFTCRSSHRRCYIKKGVLGNFAKFTGKHLCQSLFFNKVAGLRSQRFSCEFCEISKKTFFIEHLRTTASILGISANHIAILPKLSFIGWHVTIQSHVRVGNMGTCRLFLKVH